MKLQDLLKRITPLPWRLVMDSGSQWHLSPPKETNLPFAVVIFRRTAEENKERQDLQIAYLHHAADVLPELVEALAAIVDFGFDAGYNCIYCGQKTYGLGDKMTCDHYDDCLWVRAKSALARAEEVKE